MATKEVKKAAFDSSGNLIVNLDKQYTFRQPKGRDLATIQRSLLADEKFTGVELFASIVSALSVDPITFEDALDLPADVLVDLGGILKENFRVFRD